MQIRGILLGAQLFAGCSGVLRNRKNRIKVSHKSRLRSCRGLQKPAAFNRALPSQPKGDLVFSKRGAPPLPANRFFQRKYFAFTPLYRNSRPNCVSLPYGKLQRHSRIPNFLVKYPTVSIIPYFYKSLKREFAKSTPFFVLFCRFSLFCPAYFYKCASYIFSLFLIHFIFILFEFLSASSFMGLDCRPYS